MDSLEYPDQIHFNAAQGWFELGNFSEAAQEMQNLTRDAQQHPAVLELRWQIAVKKSQWSEALQVAEVLCRLAPTSPFGWIHRSYCLHELKRTEEAWDSLLPMADRFPKEWLVCYNLACYACQLSRIEEAKVWLARAVELGDPAEVKQLAASDADLAALFEKPI